MILIILFWILWFLWVIGLFVTLSPPFQRGHGLIAAILIGILGFKVFGNPIH